MKLILLRHATRASYDLGDSPLNQIGQIQAEDLANRISPQGSLPSPTLLLSSPKRRAQETLALVSARTGVKVRIEPRLDERHRNETLAEFSERIRKLLEDVEPTGLAELGSPNGATKRKLAHEAASAEREPCVWVCSHLDWLESALALLASDLSENEIFESWATAEFRVFKYQDGLWTLKEKGRGKEKY
jgi:phosphohistidine phosphatase SixA